MVKLEDIKTQIKKTQVCFTYKISSPNDYKLIFKSDGKNQAYSQIKEKYIEPEKLPESTYFIIGKITFHTGKKFYQGGPIALNLNVVAFINNKLVNLKKTKEDKFNLIRKNQIGIVWFDKQFIEKNGWKNKYIDNVIEKLITNKVKLDIRTLYHSNFNK